MEEENKAAHSDGTSLLSNPMPIQSRNALTIVLFSLFGIQGVLALIEIVLSILWGHTFGTVCGILALLLVGLLSYVFHSWQSDGTLKSYNRHNRRALQIGILLTDGVLVFFLIILILVHALAPDTFIPFPSSCKKTTNCSRITPTRSTNVNNGGHTSPIVNSTLTQVMKVCHSWVSASLRATILQETSTYLHARFLSFVFGFPDDFFILLNTVDNNQTTISVQSEARLGELDFGVNERRNTDFLDFIGAYYHTKVNNK